MTPFYRVFEHADRLIMVGKRRICVTQSAFLVLLCVLCSCAAPAEFTVDDKSRSLQGLKNAQVNGEDLQQFFAARVALLVPGIDGDRKGREASNGEVRPKESTNFNNGLAAAVVKPGYFLTAAHCVEGRTSIWLLGRSKGDPYGGKARVVWSSEESDLALLYSDVHSRKFFEISSDVPKVGLNVLLGGMKGGCSAGVIEQIKTSAEGSAQVLAHSAPGMRGDSGGPLTDLQGRVIGINHRGIWGFVTKGVVSSIATHINRQWLIELIEND